MYKYMYMYKYIYEKVGSKGFNICARNHDILLRDPSKLEMISRISSVVSVLYVLMRWEKLGNLLFRVIKLFLYLFGIFLRLHMLVHV